MKIFVITEGGKTIGRGHITRCLSLSSAFEERGYKPTLIVNGDETVSAALSGIDNKIFDWSCNEKRLFSYIKGADIAVIDSYHIDMDFCKAIAKTVKVPVFIDDNRRMNYPCGVVVNGNVYARELDYPACHGTKYLLGAAYTPLRRAFWKIGGREVRREAKKIIVIMGGCDVRGLTPCVLEMLERRFPTIEKDVISSSLPFQREGGTQAKTRFFCNVDDEKLKDLMLGSDIAITAGGQTLYELATTGVPAIAVSVVENQVMNVTKWDAIGFADNAGPWDSDRLLENIERALAGLQDLDERRKRMRIGRETVDGMGALRIVDEVLKYA